MRRMLMMQDRAAIAKGMVGRMLAAADCGSDHGGSVSVVSREIRRNGGKCGYQPVWQLMRNTPETPDLTKDPQNSMPHRVLKAPGAGGFEAFQDTPAKSSRGLRAEADDGSLEIRARAPPAVERE